MKIYKKRKLGKRIMSGIEKLLRTVAMTVGTITTLAILFVILIDNHHDTPGTITGSLADSILSARGYFEEDQTVATRDFTGKTQQTGMFSAYTSRVEETDGSPYITADGTDLKKVFSCVVANNSLKMGSRIEVEGIGICEVHDRLNSRYNGEYFDLYFGNDVKRALEFGKRELQYTVL